VFTFATREVAEVMVPAPDVVWLDAALDVEEALSRARSARHSRYPVGRGTLDEMVGLVHLRDLAAAARERPGVRVEAITRPAPIVPETKDLGALLRELREARQQMAVVLDEYGNTAGTCPWRTSSSRWWARSRTSGSCPTRRSSGSTSGPSGWPDP
jgi:putative hemolysin